METCPRCNAQFSEFTESGMCLGCEGPPSVSRPGVKGPVAALIVSCIPFVFSFSTSSSRSMSIDGMAVAETVTRIDYVAVGAGGLGAILGLVMAIVSVSSKNWRGLALAVLALLIGLLHVARGLV